MEKTYEENDEIQIDLLELLEALRRRIWLILLALVLGGGVGVAYTKLVMTPIYSSTAMVYMLSKETTLTSLADLQIGSQLTNDYRVMVTSRPVLQEVIDNLGLDTDYTGLRGQLSLDNPADTRILSITAADPDPARAKAIVDEVARVSSNYIADIMEMVPPKIIEDGVVPESPSSPSVRRNGAVCALLFGMAVCGVICLRVILNDTIRSEEDVQRYLGLTVLAAIPREDEEGDKGKYGRYGHYGPQEDSPQAEPPANQGANTQEQRESREQRKGREQEPQEGREQERREGRERKSRRRQPRTNEGKDEMKSEEGRGKEQ